MQYKGLAASCGAAAAGIVTIYLVYLAIAAPVAKGFANGRIDLDELIIGCEELRARPSRRVEMHEYRRIQELAESSRIQAYVGSVLKPWQAQMMKKHITECVDDLRARVGKQ